MTRMTMTQPTRRTAARVLTGAVLAATFALGAFAGPASAQDRRYEHRNYRNYHHNWNGGYYRSPPVIYGSPGYYPPPVVYGPGIGFNFMFR